MKNLPLLVTLSLWAASPVHAFAAERVDEAKSPIGRKVQAFTLKDYRGKSHTLDEFKSHKLLVVAFLGTECPLAKLYAARLVELEKTYRERGVGFLGINANAQDSITEIASHARIHKIGFPVLKDVGNVVADQMGAVRTPEVFVLDGDRAIRYWGRIDDEYGVGYARDEATTTELKDALEELLAGKAVTKAVSKSVGCYIGRIQEPRADSRVTWSNQISRLFQKRCVECHRDGDIAPFALTEYSEAAGWADTIAEVVEDRRMPPWHADPKHGHFANDRSLTKQEKQLIYDWVSAGAPEGDPKEAPQPRTFTAGWQLPRKPERVVNMREEAYQVPAEGTVRYQYFSAPSGFKKDRWVKMAEVQPGNAAVVHHILVFVRPPKGKAVSPLARSEWLAGYVPGLRAKPYPKGMAKLIPAGSDFVFQVHYTPNGSPQEDLSRVGLVFADPKEVDHAILTTKAANARFRIPPNDGNHRVEATSRATPVDVKLLGFMPHMHLRGKSFNYELRYPNGKREMMLDVPRYDFNWQTAYRLEEPKSLPAGTRMHCVAHFDNSDQNLANPDPQKTVRWGDQTWNEMMIGYFDIAVPHAPGEDTTAPPPDRSAEIITRYDKDKNGTVERSEAPLLLRRTFDRLDANKDKVLTVEEVRKRVK